MSQEHPRSLGATLPTRHPTFERSDVHSYHLPSVLHQVDANDSQERSKAQLTTKGNGRDPWSALLVADGSLSSLPRTGPAAPESILSRLTEVQPHGQVGPTCSACRGPPGTVRLKHEPRGHYGNFWGRHRGAPSGHQGALRQVIRGCPLPISPAPAPSPVVGEGPAGEMGNQSQGQCRCTDTAEPARKWASDPAEQAHR